MTVLLEYFDESVHSIRVLNGVLYMHEWASIIQTFQLSELTSSPMSLDNEIHTNSSL